MSDAYDFKDAGPAPRVVNRSDLPWNIATGVVVFIALMMGCVFLLIFVNPASSLNPFPPPTLPPTLALPTATATPLVMLPPTWTPAPTEMSTATPTLRPSSTPIPSETAFLRPTDTVTPGGPPLFAFVLQRGSPQYIPNIIRAEAGCNWLGVAGQANALNGAPVVGLFVQLGGVLNGQPVETRLSMTGTAPEYGSGGFEFVIGDKPLDSKSTLWIQLMDQSNLPLSEPVYFDTFADCQKNLVLINFMQVK